MKIAILGYGKMGKAIESLLDNENAEAVYKVNSANAPISTELLKKADVAIEFSTPKTAVANIEKCFEAGVPVVVGTTGWYGKLKYITELCEQKQGAILYASNFSVGMNLFFALNKKLAQLTEDMGFDCTIKEMHHTQKLDKPSGTAITLADDIIWQSNDWESWELEPYDKKAKQIPIKSIREGDVKGIHRIKFFNELDTISIQHTAHSRNGFAQGAIFAAKWLKGKTGVYKFSDVLKL